MDHESHDYSDCNDEDCETCEYEDKIQELEDERDDLERQVSELEGQLDVLEEAEHFLEASKELYRCLKYHQDLPNGCCCANEEWIRLAQKQWEPG